MGMCQIGAQVGRGLWRLAVGHVRGDRRNVAKRQPALRLCYPVHHTNSFAHRARKGHHNDMSIWERIGNALSALRAGEPLSAVFEKLTTPPEFTVGFTIAVIGLGAKIAKADGTVTRDEVSAFRRVFTIPPDEEKQAARLFDMARTDVAGFEIYAAQVARMFKDRPEVLADLLEGLIYIAMADGVLHPGEGAYLDEVNRIFGLSEATYRQIKARHMPDITDPYEILGASPDMDDETLRQHWRSLVRELHPDRMFSRGVPEEAISLAEDRLAAVNDAWAEIREARGL